MQPFHVRALHLSLPFRAEPNPPTPPLAANHTDVTSPPESPKKKSKTPPPTPKPNGKKPSPLTRKKFKSIITRDSKRVRKTKGAREQQERVLDETGFVSDNWGKDGTSTYWTSECNLFHFIELAPPSPTKRRTTSKLRPRKEIVPEASNLSSSSRALPPHHIPYVRRTEGYISDQAERCNNVLRGSSRVQPKVTLTEIMSHRCRISFRA